MRVKKEIEREKNAQSMTWEKSARNGKKVKYCTRQTIVYILIIVFGLSLIEIARNSLRRWKMETEASEKERREKERKKENWKKESRNTNIEHHGGFREDSTRERPRRREERERRESAALERREGMATTTTTTTTTKQHSHNHIRDVD